MPSKVLAEPGAFSPLAIAIFSETQISISKSQVLSSVSEGLELARNGCLEDGKGR